jgi:hypothetical protein
LFLPLEVGAYHGRESPAMSVAHRTAFPLLLALAAGGCSEPPVMKFGRGPDGAAGAAGMDGPGFGFSVPDGGAGDGGPGLPTGNEPTCASQAFMAEQLPLDLVVLVDSSGSMAELVAGAGLTKWQMVQAALYAFVKDPGSSGLGIGLQYFPLLGAGSPCRNPGECGFTESNPLPVCEQHRACVGPGVAPGAAVGCSTFDLATCPAGTTCQIIGVCAMTGVECAPIGMPCPGGVAGDMCAAPATTCYSAALVCAPDSYARLAVDISALPAAAGPFVRSLAVRRPGGLTPLYQGAVGALNNLRARLTAMPRRRAALIIATDGLPAGCGNQDIPIIADSLYTARTTAPAVPTYIIGVLDPAFVVQGTADFSELAGAGGTRDPFILTPTSALTQKLLDALSQIRNGLACEYVIPEDAKAMIDFGKVNLTFTGASATEESVPYVARPDRCDPARGGWYYDADPAVGGAPTRVIACDATCRRFRSEPTGKVNLRFGCKTIVIQ